jgi:hypothetical protein
MDTESLPDYPANYKKDICYGYDMFWRYDERFATKSRIIAQHSYRLATN